MDFALKSIQSIFTALIVIIVFGQVIIYWFKIDNDSYQNEVSLNDKWYCNDEKYWLSLIKISR